MPDALPILIIKTGSTHAPLRERLGDFEDWIAAGLQSGGAATVVHDARGSGSLPAPDRLAGAVITGSHSMVSDREPWSEALLPWLQSAVRQDLPLLGICYGHQLLAHALGGEVGHHPAGVEIGTVVVNGLAAATTDPLLGTLPASFDAQAVHWQSVRRLPPGAIALARNAHDAHHAFRVGRHTWGVQFHPEFSDEAMRSYLERMENRLKDEGLDAAAISTAVRVTPEAASLLPHFARLALGH
ncbi:MAG: glutamine amidotransferase [Burkholderiaceae bacterium]